MNKRQKKIMVPYEEKTDTCPDCSNIPCNCGIPAGYTPTPRTDENLNMITPNQRLQNGNNIFVAKMEILMDERTREIRKASSELIQEIKSLKAQLTAVTEQLKETQEALAAEIKHHTETTAKWNGHHMDLTITQCDLNTAHRTLKEVTEQRDAVTLRLGDTQVRMFDAERQRDRLAEALRKITEYDLGDIPIGVVRKCNEALQTLNQTTREI